MKREWTSSLPQVDLNTQDCHIVATLDLIDNKII
jgi:hypothetical protein